MVLDGTDGVKRRQALRLIGTGSVLCVTGCVADTEPIPAGHAEPERPTTTPRSPTATATATDASRVRQWANEAEPRGPTRPDGEPVSVDRTITDEPGYEPNNLEYFPENGTVRYVKYRSGGEPAGYDTWSFEEWGRIETADAGAARVRTVTARRLGVTGIGGGIATPPEEADTEGLVITVQVSKTLNRDGEVVSWPAATFPALVAAAPRAAEVTLSIEGDTFSRSVPVYARYTVLTYD